MPQKAMAGSDALRIELGHRFQKNLENESRQQVKSVVGRGTPARPIVVCCGADESSVTRVFQSKPDILNGPPGDVCDVPAGSRVAIQAAASDARLKAGTTGTNTEFSHVLHGSRRPAGKLGAVVLLQRRKTVRSPSAMGAMARGFEKLFSRHNKFRRSLAFDSSVP